MAGLRTPGAIGTSGHTRSLEDGTSVRALTPDPGPVGLKQLDPLGVATGPGDGEKLPVLRLNGRGRFVGLLQAQLNARSKPGPGLRTDGYFGPLTRQAVVQYQKQARIVADGVVGPATWAALLKGQTVVVAIEAKPLVNTVAAVASTSAVRAPVITPVVTGLASAKPTVASWTLEERFKSVLERTVPKLPGNIQAEFRALLSAESLAMLAGGLAVWALSHAVGVGEVVDILLLLAGVVFLGFAAVDVVKHLGSAISLTVSAVDEQELDEAAGHLAKAIAIVGVAVFVALVAKAAGKAKGGGKKSGAAAAGEAEAGETAAKKPAKKPPEAELPPFQRYMRMAETLDVSSHKDGAVFYSGPGNRALAETHAAKTGKVTLESTRGGKALDDMKLYDADSPLTATEADQVWARLSQRYAEQASGEVTVFVDGAKPDRIFMTVEKPALEKNPKVTTIKMGGH